MSRKAIISTAVAPIHKEPIFSSEMITQALIWEFVEVIEESNDWVYVLMDDGYNGWLHSFYLCQSEFLSYKFQYLIKRSTPIYREQHKIDSVVSILSFGSRIPIFQELDASYKIVLPDGGFAYMDKQVKSDVHDRKSIVKLAISLQRVPYLWGGKSSFGYDCSGFVQMVLKVNNILIKRDARIQLETKGLEKININQALPGDLIFFSDNDIINHVGFLIEGGKIIHCSGQVKIESIIEGESDYNDKLGKLSKTIMSISALLD